MDYVWLCQFDTINYELGLGQVSVELYKCILSSSLFDIFINEILIFLKLRTAQRIALFILKNSTF